MRKHLKCFKYIDCLSKIQIIFKLNNFKHKIDHLKWSSWNQNFLGSLRNDFRCMSCVLYTISNVLVSTVPANLKLF